MNEHKKLIEEEEFDNIIILDACRFDVFKNFYQLYPNVREGKLSKIETKGSNTIQTLECIFDGNYEWEVLSAQPVINSSGTVPEIDGRESDYKASDHFAEIHDLWKKTDDRVVEPKNVRKYIQKNELSSERINLIWIMQPHAPHIGSISLGAETHLYRSCLPLNYEMREGINTPPVGSEISELVRQSYKMNLLLALYELMNILPLLEGKTVVTSDHGEVLFDEGKENYFGHPHSMNLESLIEVPWLVIEDGSDLFDVLNSSNREFIEECYKAVLDREVRQEGLEAYGEKLGDGLSRRKFLEILIHSEEFSEERFNPNKVVE